jgi:hypothetical protein
MKKAATLDYSRAAAFFICLWYNDLPALPNQDLRRTVMQKDIIKIDVGLIPNYVRDDLAAATLEFMKRILEQPGGRKMLDTKMTQRAKKQGRSGQYP